MLKSLTLPPAVADLVDRIGGPRRALTFGIGISASLLILGLARWAAAPEWVPLMNQVPLESAANITDRLTDAGIQHRLDSGGSRLLVTAEDLARARVTLARDGGLDVASGKGPGMELFDQPSWGMTEFTQRMTYRRALEGELERTIGRMRGVEIADVSLAIPETPAFRSTARQAEASVVLKLKSGSTPEPSVVMGIQHLVASSVDGIESDRVSVLDDTGRLLTSPFVANSPEARAQRDLETRRSFEDYLEAQAEELVSQVVGPGNVRIQVSAEINYDQVQRQTETVDPDGQVIATEQKAEIIPGTDGGAGSSNVTAQYLNSRTIEQFTGSVGGIRRLSVAVLLNEQAGPNAGNENAAAWPAEELARIERLVATSVGITADRGDEIAVASIPFRTVPAPDAPVLSLWEQVDPYRNTILAAFAILVVAGIAFFMLKKATPTVIEVAAEPAVLAAPADDETEIESPASSRALPTPQEEVRQKVVTQVRARPEISVRVVQAWMRDR